MPGAVPLHSRGACAGGWRSGADAQARDEGDTVSEREQLLADLEQQENRIARAQWAFIHQARAKPAVLVVPDAFERRKAINARLAEIAREQR